MLQYHSTFTFEHWCPLHPPPSHPRSLSLLVKWFYDVCITDFAGLTNRCIMCKVQSESVIHLFNECLKVKILYRLIELRMKVKIPGGLSNEDENTVASLKELRFSIKERPILLITQFVIWRERCTRTFRE